jgi:hypothetical protein
MVEIESQSKMNGGQSLYSWYRGDGIEEKRKGKYNVGIL